MVVRVLELNFPSKCGIIHSERENKKMGRKLELLGKRFCGRPQNGLMSFKKMARRTDGLHGYVNAIVEITQQYKAHY